MKIRSIRGETDFFIFSPTPKIENLGARENYQSARFWDWCSPSSSLSFMGTFAAADLQSKTPSMNTILVAGLYRGAGRLDWPGSAALISAGEAAGCHRW
jgi:hypothetical protein